MKILTKNFRLWQKLACLGVMVVVLFAVPLMIYVWEADQSITFARRERQGVVAVNSLLNLMQMVQRHHDAAHAVLSGDHAQSDSLRNSAAAIDRIVRTPPEEAAALGVTEEWEAIGRDWATLKAELPGWTPARSDDRHLQMLRLVLVRMTRAADLSDLTLDPQLDTYYLMAVAIQFLPALSEEIHQVSSFANGLGAQARLVLAQQLRLAGMLAHATDRLDAIESALDKAYGVNPAARTHLAARARSQIEQTRAALAPFDPEQDELAAGSADLAALLDRQWQFNLAVLAQLDAALEARMDHLGTHRNLLLSGVLSLFFVTLGVATYIVRGMLRSITRPLQALIGGTQAVARGELGFRLDLSGAYEFSELAEHFNYMVARIEDSTASVVRAQSRLQAVLDHVPEGIVGVDETCAIESFSQGAEAMFGYTAQEVIGSKVNVLMPEPDHGDHLCRLRGHLPEGVDEAVGTIHTLVGRRRDGSQFFAEISISTLQHDGRRLYIGLVRDITERRRAEERFRTVFNASPNGMLMTDAQGRITLVNQQIERLFGYARDELIGQPVECLIPERLRERHCVVRANYFSTAAARSMTNKRDLCGRGKDGSEIPLEIGLSLIETPEGPQVLAVMANISERQRVERMKSEFVSMVSHELRTPLTSIRGSLGLVIGGVGGVLPEQARKLIGIAHNNCERLILLINDILDMEKVEAGKMSFQFGEHALMNLVEQALEANREYAAPFGVGYRLAAAAPSIMVRVDSGRFLQVMANLLSNAAKFSPRGGEVEVAVSLRGEHARVAVSDQGSGIPREFQSRIFQKFSQADSSDTRQKGGTGLGLALCKAMIEQMGGRIGFESEPGIGTTFHIELPVLVSLPQPAATAEDSSRPRILICEDDFDVAHLIAIMLEQRGYASDIAVDAAQAKALLAAGNVYKAMTVDLMLPDQDGLSLIAESRKLEATRDLPMLVVSAKAEEGKRDLRGAGLRVMDWLAKPIDERRMVEAVHRAVRGKRDRLPQVLHVEDDADIRDVVLGMLGGMAQVDGAASLREAEKALAGQRYDLVILDIGLPDGAGTALLPMLSAQVPPIPVMVFSGVEMGDDAVRNVRAALVKARTTNEEFVRTIEALFDDTFRDASSS